MSKFYIVEANYIGAESNLPSAPIVTILNRPERHISKSDSYIERDGLPSVVTKENPIVIDGDLGTSVDWSYWAHGEYDTLYEAVCVVSDKFDILHESDKELDDGEIKVFVVGKYKAWPKDQCSDWAFEYFEDSITKDSTDKQLEKLAIDIEQDANAEDFTGKEFWLPLAKAYRDDLD